jgi:hypothetical protein
MIINNWKGKNWKLVHETTGELVEFDEALTTFRGNTVYFRSGTPPHHPGSTGKIVIVHERDTVDLFASGEYYPSVCGLKWVEMPLPQDTDNN